MLTWILLGVLAMVGGAFVAYRVGRAKGASAARALPAATSSGRLLERTVRDVRVDDVVQHGGRDWLVEGVVTYDEDGHTWRGARVIDGPEERWVIVGLERTGGLTVRLCALASDLALTGYPPERIEHGGVAYAMGQRGTATATLAGELGTLPGWKTIPKGASARCRWWRYNAAGEKTLVVEQWGETYRALVGEMVPADQVDLLAGS